MLHSTRIHIRKLEPLTICNENNDNIITNLCSQPLIEGEQKDDNDSETNNPFNLGTFENENLNRSIVNLYKLCFEEMGYDLGATYNKIEYKNYLYDNPIHLANTDESFLYDNAPTKLTKEDMEFIKSLNIQDGGEGLEHQGNFTDRGNFVKTMFNGFISKGVNNVVSVCMTAQAALESDWGKSHYAHFSNYGGINYHKGASFSAVFHYHCNALGT